MKQKLSEISAGFQTLIQLVALVALASFWVAGVNDIEENVNRALAENRQYFEQIVEQLKKDGKDQAVDNLILRTENKILQNLAQKNGADIEKAAIQLAEVEEQLLTWLNLLDSNQQTTIVSVRQLQKNVEHLTAFIKERYPTYSPPIADLDRSHQIYQTDKGIK